MLGDDSKTTLGMPFWRKIVVGGSNYAYNKKGDNMTLQKWSVLNRGGIYNSKKYGLNDMQHKIPTYMWPQNNRKLSGFFYSNFIILSSMFRPLDIIFIHLLLNT